MSKKAYFIEKSYILAALICIKNKYFCERYVTITECNKLIRILREIFQKQNVEASIVDEIDNTFFTKFSDLVILGRDISLEDVKTKYFESLPVELASIIWDDETICKSIYSKKRIEQIPSHDYCEEDSRMNKIKFGSLDKIIDKIVENPGLFYERVASELSEVEYNYIKEQITDKTCNNCKNADCEIIVCASNIGPCSEWVNNELIGKKRVLIK